MCTVQKDAFSCRISTFSAHCQLVGRISGLIFVRGERPSLIGAAVSRSCVMDGTSMMPGVLFWVMQQWRHFVHFKARLVVGLRVCMMVGESVMQGIVIIGVSLITVCSSACTCSCDASATHCSLRTRIGFNKGSILCPRYFINCLPLVV